MSDLVGKTLGKYKIIERVGQGGMSQVYRAWHPTLERPVAIKILPSDRADDVAAVARFKREAMAVARLRHPHIVQVHDFDVIGNLHYMVMEWVDGPTLAERLRPRPPQRANEDTSPLNPAWRGRLRRILDKRFDEGELQNLCFDLDISYDDLPATGQENKARELLDYLERHNQVAALIVWGKTNRTDIDWDAVIGQAAGTSPASSTPPFSRFPLAAIVPIFTDLAAAIDYAHAQGMIHCDLKPGNVLFNSAGEVRLTDFGIVRILGDAHYSYSGAIAGTPAYISPEQIMDGTVDNRSDIYALGVILYEMATGHRPFVAGDLAAVLMYHVQGQPQLPRTFNPDLSPVVEQVILKALQRNPQDRYQSAGELARALQKAVLPEVISPPQEVKERFQAPPDVAYFVGREQILAHYGQLLTVMGKQNRLCLTGMGGVGKTTLAIRLAHQLRDYFSDGVLWADLAHSEPLAVLDSWARAYDLDFSGLSDLSSRAAALRGKLAGQRVLLVLDDVWQADRARPLLLVGPPAAILITTRNTRLAQALDGHEFHVTVLEPVESRQLLAQIAGKERVAAEAEAAEEIGRLLGYWPLAVKIAAQQALLPRWRRLADLAVRLHQEKNRLDLEIADREVRASFAASWQALSPSLQRAFVLLGVFSGRALTAEAYIAVSQMEAGQAIDSLYALVALSLLEEEGELHYRQHPLLADFAHEQLGGDPAAYDRYLRYFLTLAENAASHLQSSGQLLSLEQLESEHDNLLAALQRAWDQGDIESAARFCGAMGGYWGIRGYLGEGKQRLAAVLGQRQQLSAGTLANVLFAAGWLAFEQGDYPSANQFYEESLTIWRELDHVPKIAELLISSGHVAQQQGDFDRAGLFYKDSLTLYQQLDEKGGIALALNRLGHLAQLQADYVGAEGFLKQSLALRRALGDKRGMASSLNALAEIARYQGDYVYANTLYEEGLALCRQLGDRRCMAGVGHNLGYVAQQQGDWQRAAALFQESLTLFQELDNRGGIALCLAGLAGVIAGQGKIEEAAQLLGAAQSLLAASQTLLSPADEQIWARNQDAIRAQLAETVFTNAWATGQAMPFVQAIASALLVSTS
jgi:serine/threonine protein kinase